MTELLPQPDYPLAASTEAIRCNLETVRQRIRAACLRSGRAADAVRLLPVTKTLPAERVRQAHAAGCLLVGENKIQEARGKAAALADVPGLAWSVIGHLQTNKVRQMIAFASEFQALDSLRLAEELERRLQGAGRPLDVYLQVNTSGEASKFGMPPEALPAFLRDIAGFDTLRVRGLMTLALHTRDAGEVRACFRRLRTLRDRARDHAAPHQSLDELSMGMSGDYEIAIEEGATVVRVGQAIFGARALPDSHYWPDRPPTETPA